MFSMTDLLRIGQDLCHLHWDHYLEERAHTYHDQCMVTAWSPAKNTTHLSMPFPTHFSIHLSVPLLTQLSYYNLSHLCSFIFTPLCTYAPSPIHTCCTLSSTYPSPPPHVLLYFCLHTSLHAHLQCSLLPTHLPCPLTWSICTLGSGEMTVLLE